MRHGSLCWAVLGLAPAAVFGQCTTDFTGFIGGATNHVATIDSGRVVAASGRGIDILSVANPGAITRTGGAGVQGRILKVRVAGGLAYVLCEDGGDRVIRRYRVGGAAPVFLDEFWRSSRADFEVSGVTVFVAAHGVASAATTVTALDVSFPETPLLAGSVSLGVDVAGAEVYAGLAGSRVMVCTYGASPGGWRVWGVQASDPSAMTVLDSFATGNLSPSAAFAASGSYVFAGSAEGVDILNLPSRLGFTRVGTIGFPGTDLGMVGTTLFVASEEGGVRPYNVANPASPVAYPPYDTSGSSADLAILGDRCYSAEREGGLAVLQIGNPNAVTLLGSLAGPRPSIVEDVQASGGVLYVLDHYGVRAFSLANPDAPTFLGQVALADAGASSCGARVLRVSGGNAYVSGCDGRFRVVSIADPGAMFVRAELAGVQADYDTAFWGSYAYACGFGGLKIISVANPSSPSVAGEYTAGGVAMSVEVQGGYAYLGTRDFGLWVLSLANPASPQLVGYAGGSNRGACYGLALNGSVAYVSRASVVEVYDVSDPSRPGLVGEVGSVFPDVKDPVRVRQGRLYVAGLAGDGPGVSVMDIGDAAHPARIGGAGMGDLWGFEVASGRVYGGDRARDELAIGAVQTQWAPAFRTEPPDAMPCLGGSVTLACAVTANPAVLSLRWLRDGVPLQDGPRVSGSGTAALTLTGLVEGDAGVYVCRATNACGTGSTGGARLSFCAVDFNCDGFVDFFDYDAFIECFVGGACPPGRDADFNGDGFGDFFDYDDFVGAFEMGC